MMFGRHGGGATRGGGKRGGGPIVGGQPAGVTVLFSDDFSSGDLLKSQDGWSWSHFRNMPTNTSGGVDAVVAPPGSAVRCDVVNGWSHLGFTGNSVRFRFPNTEADMTVTAAASASSGATNISVNTLAHGIPNGTVVTFTGGKVATLTATAAISATSLSVSALTSAVSSGNTASVPTQAWSELNFLVGTAACTELWVRYHLYYPIGTETDVNGLNAGWLGPAFAHGNLFTAGNINDKFATIYETYSSIDNAYQWPPASTLETWYPWNQGGPDAGGHVVAGLRRLEGHQLDRHTNVGGDWDKEAPWSETGTGSWITVDYGTKIADGPGVANGFMRVYRDGTKVYEETGLDNYITCSTLSAYPGMLYENRWKAGYLMGYRNSGSSYSADMHAYISGVQFSNGYLG